MIVLISCSSPDTHSIHLFRVGSAELVDAAANLTDVSVNDLQINELPDHWYWGLSGQYMFHCIIISALTNPAYYRHVCCL